MTNVERLQKWYDEEKEKGLLDLNFFLNPNTSTDAEEVCGSVLNILDSKAKGEYTRIISVSNNDPLKDIKGEITDLVTDNFEDLLA